jgi:FkbM family methyltransferase
LDFNAALIKRRLVEKIGPAETKANSPAASTVTTVDLAPLLSIADDASFVRESYLRVLGRECDVGGFVHYRELLRNHYPRRSMILQLVESAEAKATGRRYVGLWPAGQGVSGLPGARWAAAIKLALWNRARRLFEYFLRVSRVEAIELKLDYVLQENALQAERSMGRLDHTLFTISDKVDRYVAELVVKQTELATLTLENRGAQESLAADLRQQQRLLQTLQQAGQQAATQLAQLQAAHQATRQATDQAAAELAQLQAALADVRTHQRAPVFQAGPDVIVTEVDGFLLGVPSQEWRLAAYYGLRGLPEPGMMRLFRSLVQPGMVVVDIGAHIGIYTLYALRGLGGHGRVYSFEPTPRTFALLHDNVQVNGFLESGMIRFDRRAVADRAGAATFTAYASNSGHNTLFAGAAGGETLTVETVTLDEALAAEPRIDVIKIDAEGGEPLILRGMARILAQNPEIRIFVEFGPEHLRRAGIEPLQWLEELGTLGLRVQRVEDVSGEPLPLDLEAAANCVSWNLLLTRA